MTSMYRRPFKLISKIQYYDWGTKNAAAFIPSFLGIPAEKDRPYAELWIGAHPTAPSEILLNGQPVPLDKAIESAPREILGEDVARRFGGKLPFLLKVLSAGAPLSIQTHPNKEQAHRLHAKDPAHYPDDNHKPEIAIALDGLTAIAGFGSLMLANHQGIKSLGQVMSVGIAACMIAALMVLPALLRLLTHWGWKLKPDQRHRGSSPDKA